VKICFCRRCDEKDTYYPLEYDHEYDKEFKRVNCYNHIYTCKRCRHQRFDYLKATLLIGDQGIHRFGDWYETKPGLFSRDCMDCSYSEEGHKLY
jgi:5-methylcytosine-specific restriction endonuclease McrA